MCWNARATLLLLMLNDPDVAESNRVAVILQSDWKCFRRFRLTCSGLPLNIEVVVNQDTVMADCQASILNLLSFFIESR